MGSVLRGTLGLAEFLDWALERQLEARIFREKKPCTRHRAQAPKLLNECKNSPIGPGPGPAGWVHSEGHPQGVTGSGSNLGLPFTGTHSSALVATELTDTRRPG